MPHNTKSYMLDAIFKKRDVFFLILHMNTMSNAYIFFLGIIVGKFHVIGFVFTSG